VAAAAYMSCSAILNDYDGVQHDYTRKQGLVWQQVFLPENAPAEWADRSLLWNAVEETEKTKDSRLAREFVVALPVELGQEEWKTLLTEFIQNNFVSDGMCADVAIHDTDGHNPHAHILLTVRPLDERGKWQYKTEKEYLCVKGDEERGFTAAELKAAQTEGWEKQYPYKVGKKKVYMTPSAAEAQGYVRASKYPKSTKYGRQNPISLRWNSDEQLVLWRESWAETVNRSLARSGRAERIDHRSHAARGLDEQPTVHEGVTARALERQDFVADRCELNRQIKADNALLRELKNQVKKLVQAVQDSIPALAEAMETLRQQMLIFCYQLRHIRAGKTAYTDYLQTVRPLLKRYAGLKQKFNETRQQRKALLAEKRSTSVLHLPKQHDLSRRIAALTEDLEDLRTQRTMTLRDLHCTDDAELAAVKKSASEMEASLEKLTQQEQRYEAELTAARTQYAALTNQSADLDLNALQAARMALRPDKERTAAETLQAAYGTHYDPAALDDSKQALAELLGEKTEKPSLRKKLRSMEHTQPPSEMQNGKHQEPER
jgi:hypothetical protein